MNRRNFLKCSAGTLVAPLVFPAQPDTLLGGSTPIRVDTAVVRAPLPEIPRFRRWTPYVPGEYKSDIPIEAYGQSVMVQYDAGSL